MHYWPAIVFGWPAATIGGFLLVFGIIRQKAWLCVAGAILAAGFCTYMALNPPPARWIGLFALAGNFVCAVAVRRRAIKLAAFSLTPCATMFFILAFVVLTE
jgi:hypothetical protein